MARKQSPSSKDIEVVLLDIEGTVCPISFVKEVLFPYALEALPSTLATQWDAPEFLPYRDTFPSKHRATPEAFSNHVWDLMSQDLKIPYLKSLQGYLWLQGYQTGALRCPLFLDVEPRLQAWHRASIPIIIYSSGSVPAQKLLFQYTNSTPEADLRNLISDYFDTVNAGPKAEKESYEKISSTRDVEIGKWLFLSDNVKEVTAARQAGMQSWIVFREGNPPLSKEDMEGENIITSFEEIPAGKTDESDFRKREREELETDDITPTDQVKRRRKGEPDELVEWNGFEKGKAKGMGEPEDKPKGLETLLDVEGKGVETVAAHPSVSLQSTEAGPDTEDASGKFNAATKVDRSAS